MHPQCLKTGTDTLGCRSKKFEWRTKNILTVEWSWIEFCVMNILTVYSDHCHYKWHRHCRRELTFRSVLHILAKSMWFWVRSFAEPTELDVFDLKQTLDRSKSVNRCLLELFQANLDCLYTRGNGELTLNQLISQTKTRKMKDKVDRLNLFSFISYHSRMTWASHCRDLKIHVAVTITQCIQHRAQCPVPGYMHVNKSGKHTQQILAQFNFQGRIQAFVGMVRRKGLP